MMSLFVYMLILVIAIISLSVYLILARKDHLMNYENKLRGINKKRKSKIKYIFGTIYIIVTVTVYMIFILDSITNENRDTSMNEVAIAQFNSIFSQYEGENAGIKIRNLLSTIISMNSYEENEDKIIIVEFCNDGEIITEKDPTHYVKDWSINSKIKNNEKYNVEFGFLEKGCNKGIINKVKISEVNENG